jgi:hypothetical protein
VPCAAFPPSGELATAQRFSVAFGAPSLLLSINGLAE